MAYMLFSNIFIKYSQSKNSYLRNYNYTTSSTIISSIDSINNKRTFYCGLSLDKTFTNIGLSLKSEINYNYSNYILFQNNVSFKNYSHIISLSINSIFNKLSWIKFIYTFIGNVSWQYNIYNDSYPLYNYNNDIKLIFFVNKKLSVNILHQNIINEIQKSKYYNYNFIDFEIKYCLNKKIEISGKINNLFNDKEYY